MLDLLLLGGVAYVAYTGRVGDARATARVAGRWLGRTVTMLRRVRAEASRSAADATSSNAALSASTTRLRESMTQLGAVTSEAGGIVTGLSPGVIRQELMAAAVARAPPPLGHAASLSPPPRPLAGVFTAAELSAALSGGGGSGGDGAPSAAGAPLPQTSVARGPAESWQPPATARPPWAAQAGAALASSGMGRAGGGAGATPSGGGAVTTPPSSAETIVSILRRERLS